jgi:hypothetical protein
MTTYSYPDDFCTFGNLIEPVLPPNQKWLLVCDDVQEIFSTGQWGINLGQLVGQIARIYAKLAKSRPTIKWEDEDLGSGESYFWGDHAFPEQIEIDSVNQIVNIHTGS